MKKKIVKYLFSIIYSLMELLKLKKFYTYYFFPTFIENLIEIDLENQKKFFTTFKTNKVNKNNITNNKVEDIIKTNKKIIFGPWLGEVGYELLYWIPFIRKLCKNNNLSYENIYIISRGGVSEWYSDFSKNYIDIFDLISKENFDDIKNKIFQQNKSQKQSKMKMDIEFLKKYFSETDYFFFTPSLMFNILPNYFKGYYGIQFIKKYFEYKEINLNDKNFESNLLKRYNLTKGEYTAIKFYKRESYENNESIHEMLNKISKGKKLISLDQQQTYDEHENFNNNYKCLGNLPLNQNLKIQSYIIKNSKYFYGTYGGFAYLATLLGTPNTTFETKKEFNQNFHKYLNDEILTKEFETENFIVNTNFVEKLNDI